MRLREQWRPILEAEVRKWSAKSAAQLLCELAEIQAHQIDFEDKKYQVEVQLLENTDTYVHVGVDVDDGRLPASLRPLGSSFIREKQRWDARSVQRQGLAVET